jgi:hypothetical protein
MARTMLEVLERVAKETKAMAGIPADGFLRRRALRQKLNEANALLVMTESALDGIVAGRKRDWLRHEMENFDQVIQWIAAVAAWGFARWLAVRADLPFGARSVIMNERRHIDTLLERLQSASMAPEHAGRIEKTLINAADLLDEIAERATDLPDFSDTPDHLFHQHVSNRRFGRRRAV